MFYPEISTQKSNRSILTICSSIVLTAALSLSLMTQSVEANENNTAELTKVYKVVAADGSVSFSDQPNSQSEMILIAPISTVPAIPVVHSPNTQQQNQEEQPHARYQSLVILSPENNSAFNTGSGDVDIILDIQPALISSDKIQIFLDGQLVNNDAQIQTRLQTVSRGTHQLSVKLTSANGNVLKEAASTFTVHRPSVDNRAIVTPHRTTVPRANIRN